MYQVTVDTEDGFLDEQEFESLDELVEYVNDLLMDSEEDSFDLEIRRDLQTGDSG